jgi:hypothetical protein
VSSRLEVEGALVLQPPPVASHATNLLAVVIRGRVRKRRSSGVDAVALDAVEEGGIFLLVHQYQRVDSLDNAQTHPPKLCNHAAVRQVEDLVTEDGANKPADGHHANGAHTHEHDRVKATELRRQDGVVAVADHGRQAVVTHSDGTDTRARLPNPPARPAEREEVVPCELGVRGRGGAGGRLRRR